MSKAVITPVLNLKTLEWSFKGHSRSSARG